MIIIIILVLLAIWLIEREMIAHAEHMDLMEEKEVNTNNYINNTYTGNVDSVNDRYSFPEGKYVDVEVVKK